MHSGFTALRARKYLFPRSQHSDLRALSPVLLNSCSGCFLSLLCSFLSYSLAGLYLLCKVIASAFLFFSPPSSKCLHSPLTHAELQHPLLYICVDSALLCLPFHSQTPCVSALHMIPFSCPGCLLFHSHSLRPHGDAVMHGDIIPTCSRSQVCCAALLFPQKTIRLGTFCPYKCSTVDVKKLF